jgi:Tfp pilus assembly protein PilX
MEEGRVNRMRPPPRSPLAGTLRFALALAVLLGSLSLVAWRQARALEVLSTLDRTERDLSLARAESAELERRIQVLSSRGHIVPEARDRLGMHLPSAMEQVLLDGGEL